MGQQQLLLIILGVILVAVAVAVGLTIFKAQAAGQNRDAVWNDLNQLGARAQAFYRRPSFLGGGGKSFLSFSLYTTEVKNDNGEYGITSKIIDEVIIQGTGTEIGNDQKNPVQIIMIVHPDTMYVDEKTGIN